MRVSWALVLGLVLCLGGAHAAPRAMHTVIITPVPVAAVHANAGLTREDRAANLMEDAKLSQAKILTDLQPLTLGGEAEVSELYPLWLVNRIVVTATDDVIAKLSKRSDVASVRLPKTMKLIDAVAIGNDQAPKFGKYTYGLKNLRVPEAWEKFNVDGSGIVVGHIDTGVCSIHPDLAGKIIKFKDFHGHEHATGFDGNGHGTHTAGTIVGGNAGGKHIGVAPGAKLICGRIFDEGGTTTDAIILRAMNWIADPDGDPNTNDGPRLVSNSWGGEQESEHSGDDLWQAVQHWVDLGILPVFAAGNSGPKGKVGTPGGYPMSFCVGSTNWMNWVSSFSSRGPITWDGVQYIKPDVAAPGSGVESAKDKGGYVTMDGTSMATPHVAGVCALVLQANPALTPAQVVDIVRSTAKDISTPGHDNNTGWGLVDAYRAVEKAKAFKTQGFTAGE